jgi:N-acetylmuramoyl-L-alanine amidase
MKRFALTCAALLAFSMQAAAAEPMHILIDPGHGGTDDGAIRGRIREATIALKVSQKLAEYLKNDPRFDVSLTRESDDLVALPQRAKKSNQLNADLFLSIHANASSDVRAQGVEFYFQNQLPADEESSFLASRENQSTTVDDDANTEEAVSHKGDVAHILEDLQRNYKIAASHELSKTLYWSWNQNISNKHSRPVRQAPFYVVSEVAVPSVLVELGFVSNPVEGTRLLDPAHQDRMAKSLYDGLVEYKSLYDRDHAKN